MSKSQHDGGDTGDVGGVTGYSEGDADSWLLIASVEMVVYVWPKECAEEGSQENISFRIRDTLSNGFLSSGADMQGSAKPARVVPVLAPK